MRYRSVQDELVLQTSKKQVFVLDGNTESPNQHDIHGKHLSTLDTYHQSVKHA